MITKKILRVTLSWKQVSTNELSKTPVIKNSKHLLIDSTGVHAAVKQAEVSFNMTKNHNSSQLMVMLPNIFWP